MQIKILQSFKTIELQEVKQSLLDNFIEEKIKGFQALTNFIIE